MKKTKFRLRYSVSDEDLQANRLATPKQILLWLSRANRLVAAISTPKTRDLTRRYLHGEL